MGLLGAEGLHVAGTQEQWSIGRLDHGRTGALEQWTTEALGHWTTEALGHWSIGPLKHWGIGALDHWTTEALVHWSTGALVLQCPSATGALVHWVPKLWFCLAFRWRPYRVECTGSLSTSEVKRHRARLVLGWGTAWEHPGVLPAFAACPFSPPLEGHPLEEVGEAYGTKGAAERIDLSL